jgi:hypothetical protein
MDLLVEEGLREAFAAGGEVGTLGSWFELPGDAAAGRLRAPVASEGDHA